MYDITDTSAIASIMVGDKLTVGLLFEAGICIYSEIEIDDTLLANGGALLNDAFIVTSENAGISFPIRVGNAITKCSTQQTNSAPLAQKHLQTSVLAISTLQSSSAGSQGISFSNAGNFGVDISESVEYPVEYIWKHTYATTPFNEISFLRAPSPRNVDFNYGPRGI